MSLQSRILLCVEPAAHQQVAFERLAGQLGLRHVACSSEAGALEALQHSDAVALMVVADLLSDGESCRLIETARISPRHAALPIAFLMSERNPQIARDAMLAGATEVFLNGEHEHLHQFIADCAAQQWPELSGKVLLVEDNDAEAEYVGTLCNDMGMAVDRARDVDSAIALSNSNSYQLYLVDIVLNDVRSGVAFVKHLRHNQTKRQPVLVMSGFDDQARRLLSLKSGADDYIRKPFLPEEFIWRVRRVLQGQATAEAAGSAHPASRPQSLSSLSPREHEICLAILAGTSDKDIAANLGISYWTVRSHIQNIFTKTGALNRRELMSMFIPATRG